MVGFRPGKWLSLLVLFFSLASSAASGSPEPVAERPLLSFRTVPSPLKVGVTRPVLQLEVESQFSGQEVVVEAALNGVPLKLSNPAGALWTVVLNPFSEVKPAHQLLTSVYLRPEGESKRLKGAIGALTQAVRALDTAIAAEQDPLKKAALEREREKKVSFRDEAELKLEGLKTFLKSESFSFAVEKDPTNTDFPLLLSAVPSAIPLDERARVMLTGERFGASPNVKIAGVTATILSSSPTSLVVLTQRYLSPGVKDIELTFSPEGEEPRKNAVLTNSFFVTETSILKNLKPVAVVTGFHRINLGESVTLNSTLSYDENGHVFNRIWTFRRAPATSVFPVGTTLPDEPSPVWTPDRVGIHTVELQLQEQGTEELLLSRKALVTVEVR